MQIYSQRDPTWANVTIGTGDTTIGGYGCVVSCTAMLLTLNGLTINPKEVNRILTDNKKYMDGDLIVMDWLDDMWPDRIKFLGRVDCRFNAAPITDIKTAIDKKDYPFVWVINGGVEHCLLAVAYEGNEIIVLDPWMGDKVNISKRWGTSSEKIIYVNYFDSLKPETESSVITNPAQPTENISKKASYFDKIIISLAHDEKLPDDNSNHYNEKDVLFIITNLSNREAFLSGKATKWDRTSQLLGFDNSDTTSFEDVESKIKEKDTALETAQTEVTDLKTKVQGLIDKEKTVMTYGELVSILYAKIMNIWTSVKTQNIGD